MPENHNANKNRLELENLSALIETTDVGEDDDIESCSSFSLQKCIEEFRARRIRRNSTHVSEQRDEVSQSQNAEKLEKVHSLAEADLIDQNRSNKEQERKCKPCKNGFCYCFTSDSGDGGCGKIAALSASNTARGATKRSRKSECGQPTTVSSQGGSNRVKERRSAPADLKISNVTDESRKLKKNCMRQNGTARRPLTAISRLETTSHDAPLIHIIQELRDNCVISEVRVNKQKLQNKTVTKSHKVSLKPSTVMRDELPTAPARNSRSFPVTIDTMSGDSIPVTRLEVSAKSTQRKPGAGRLLKKRLSQSNVQYKPRDMAQPPPKPPRASTGSRQVISSNSSLATTTTSVREAERVIDEFLTKKGVSIPNNSHSKSQNLQSDRKRLSFPLARSEQYLPSCPSLSDIERMVDTKSRQDYGKNIQEGSKQPVKEITFGWKEPNISEMLNYDTNGNRKEFKSQAAQAEPQSMGWQIPPKLSLDTVDGTVSHNLASNLETKSTPIKRAFNVKPKRTNPKFGWRHLPTWSAQKCPRRFLKQSKQKILKFVTPKKDNKEESKFVARKTPHRNIGIQTSPADFDDFQQCTTPQSPPGSYHSAVQTSQLETTPHDSVATTSNSRSNNPSDSTQFDFTRKVNSPPKKSVRTTQRKLDFPTVCGATSFCFDQPNTIDIDSAPSFGSTRRQTLNGRTYRSYNTDFDRDVTISKMDFILSNIRARLEASDERAIRTFEEIERREQQQAYGFDCPDGFGIRQRTRVDVHSIAPHHEHEPIYSEIEEDSIHVTESPQFDNKTGIESSSSTAAGIEVEALYAKVNKPNRDRHEHEANVSRTLPNLSKNSSRKTHTQTVNTLPIVREPSLSDISYSSPPFETSSQHTHYDSQTPSLSQCQSLNNIRVMEQNSIPKRNRNLSKSDLSLQRSEIFLENLCRSEFIVEDGALERLEKVDNHLSNRRNDDDIHANDAISYDLPDGEFSPVIVTSTDAAPKFLTKPQQQEHIKSVRRTNECKKIIAQKTQSNSCPVTPTKYVQQKTQLTQSNSQPDSLNDSNCEHLNTTTRSTTEPGSALARYKRLKQALQQSFRKSKNFVKSKRASLTQTKATETPTKITDVITETDQRIQTQSPKPHDLSCELRETPVKSTASCLNLDALIAFDDAATVTEQIARAVSICRQLPELETSRELVEAERLLLFSSLRSFNRQLVTSNVSTKQATLLERHFSIDTMRLNVNVGIDLYDYFNYYFTITFECNGQIHSTQSTECRRGEVIFRNCQIELKADKLIDDVEPQINCNIFMLRLRKVAQTKATTTIAAATTTPATAEINNVFSPHDISPLPSTPWSSMSSLGGITSRFRLYASFILSTHLFAPFTMLPNQIESNETCENNLILLRTTAPSTAANVPLKLCTTKPVSKQTNIVINASVSASFPERTFSGFLHVQDPFSLHNWNWRWCRLNGFQLQIWTDDNALNDAPLLSLNLHGRAQDLPLTNCSPELCARTRSFCLQCATSKADADGEFATAAVFFAAESDADLDKWLQHLNEALQFIVNWMK